MSPRWLSMAASDQNLTESGNVTKKTSNSTHGTDALTQRARHVQPGCSTGAICQRPARRPERRFGILWHRRRLFLGRSPARWNAQPVTGPGWRLADRAERQRDGGYRRRLVPSRIGGRGAARSRPRRVLPPTLRRVRQTADQPKHAAAAGDQSRQLSKAGAGTSRECQGDSLQRSAHDRATTSPFASQPGDLLGERLGPTRSHIAEEPPNLQPQFDRRACHRGIGQSAFIPTMDPPRGGLVDQASRRAAHRRFPARLEPVRRTKRRSAMMAVRA